jgi:SAM-dependent methyltransferase
MHHETIDFYNQYAEKLTAEYLRADRSELQRILRQWIPLGGSVLEIGCGCGLDAVFMASIADKVTATDASDEMLHQASRIKEENKMSHRILLKKAVFPLEPENPFLKEQFDVIVCIATLMHIPDNELFDFAYQIRSMLKNQGIFICSFSADGGQSHDDQRLYVDREPAEITLLFERLGFHLLKNEKSQDGLGRAINWTTSIFCFGGDQGSRPIDQIESIINRDKKTASYKLALLRSLCEISQSSFHHVRFLSNNRVSIPLGLIVER